MHLGLLIALPFVAAALADRPAATAPAPYGALPTDRQVRWEQMGVVGFIHFSVNTFTDHEWGYGDESPDVFNPTAFDADQIVSGFKAGGMKEVVLVCKHHDGLCLWPTASTQHSVAHSTWLGGHGDVVRAISDACRRHGLRFGVYLSPWDRNNPAYGTPDYIRLYREQLTELCSNYGPLSEVWFDGANGGDGYYGGARETRSIDRTTYYDWPHTWAIVRKLQPNAVMFSDVGPDVRWVGNEDGHAAETSWATFTPVALDGGPASPGNIRFGDSPEGTRNGAEWLPAEADVSIRPGWFWHASENGRVKTPAELVDLYFASVGRGANLMLNVPPARTGRLDDPDVAALNGFGEAVRGIFAHNLAPQARITASNVRGGDTGRFGPRRLVDGRDDTYWATDDEVHTPDVTFEFGRPVAFSVIRLREAIRLGQRIGAFAIDVDEDGSWREIASATSIGACRLIRLPHHVTTQRVRIRITDCPVPVALSEVGLYLEPGR